MAYRFPVVEVDTDNFSVVVECKLGYLQKVYSLRVRLIKDPNVKIFGYRDEFITNTEDFLKLQKIVFPDELVRGQHYLTSNALEKSEFLDGFIDRVRLERNFRNALEALPVSTEKRKKATL